MEKAKIIIVTGLSGSGKSTALAALEDAGFFCVDNMPTALLPEFLALPPDDVADSMGIAFVMDIRQKRFLPDYREVFDILRSQGHELRILFLEAEETVLQRRYSQTRRHHPLARGRGLIEGVRREKEILEELRKDANHVINTTSLNVHELKSAVQNIAKRFAEFTTLRIHILSFGFKFGTPIEADIIMDVRFLVNPFFVEELRKLTGEDRAVRDYVFNSPETNEFMDRFLSLLDFLIPRYEREGKAYLTIAIGCTGGQHRSVAVAGAVHEHITTSGRQAEIMHRDIGLDS